MYAYHNLTSVRNFFSRFNISLITVSLLDSVGLSPVYLNFLNGQKAPAPAQDNAMTRARSATTSDAMANNAVDVLPSIRFSTFYDPRATQPSLTFAPVSRTLPTGNEIIRVGRYSERESQPNVPHNVPSAAPVGFKSKVVSRRHCEFSYTDGKWFIKDVKSSSGTFLNHIRLSPAGSESKPFAVNENSQ